MPCTAAPAAVALHIGLRRMVGPEVHELVKFVTRGVVVTGHRMSAQGRSVWLTDSGSPAATATDVDQAESEEVGTLMEPLPRSGGNQLPARRRSFRPGPASLCFLGG